MNMTFYNYDSLKHWVKRSEHPFAKIMHTAHRKIKVFELPMPNYLALGLYKAYSLLLLCIEFTARGVFYTPMFRSKAQHCGNNLFLYGGLPYITGPLEMYIGDNCRISGRTTFTARYSDTIQPKLIIGDNVDIGWQSTLAIGTSITIGDSVRIAGGCFMGGYPGHPMDAFDRALGLPDTDNQAKDITLENDVWIGTGVTIIGGVKIGHSTIVAAGSVVTKSLPSNVLAGGNPARIIRHLSTSTKK